MSSFVQWLVSNPWVVLLGLVAAVLGAVLAIVFYYKSIRNKQPKYYVESTNFIRDFTSTITDLEVRYAGEKIENLTMTRLTFWNDGKETIDRNDIAAADPITIISGGNYRILRAGVILENNPSSMTSITFVDAQKVGVSFDYLDYRQGFVVTLLHTGLNSDDLVFSGTIKGSGKFQMQKSMDKDDPLRLPIFGKRVDLMSIIMAGAPCAFIIAIWSNHPPLKHNIGSYLFMAAMSALFLGISCLQLRYAVVPTMPRGLKLNSRSTNPPREIATK